MTIAETSDMPMLLAELTALRHLDITVGFHADKKPKREDGAATNAEVAAANEFGTLNNPRRPFLGPAMEEGAGVLQDLQATTVSAVLAGKMTAEQAAGIVGEAAVGLVKAKITSNVPPVLEQATIDAKGSSKTLVDTAQMLNAVSFEVHLTGARGD
jgi:hypothetical protein